MIEVHTFLVDAAEKAKNLPKKSPERRTIEAVSKNAGKLLKELKDPLFTALWDEQADRLIHAGVPQKLHMNETEYRNSLPKFTDEPYVQIGRDLAVTSYAPVLVETRLKHATLLEIADIDVVGKPLVGYRHHRALQPVQKTPYVAWCIEERVINAQELEGFRKENQRTGLPQKGISEVGRLVGGKYIKSDVTTTEAANWIMQHPDLTDVFDVQLAVKFKDLGDGAYRYSWLRMGVYHGKRELRLFKVETKPWNKLP